MKICILANSHAHMLKHALDGRVRTSTLQIFAAPAAGLRGLKELPGRRGLYATRPSLNRWLAKTSGGQTEIRYSNYDGFALVGLGLRSHNALKLFSRYQPFRLHLGGKASLISEQAFRDAVREQLTRTTGYQLMRMLSVQGRPVVVVPAPMPNANIAIRRGYRWLNSPDSGEATAWIRQIIEDEVKSLAAPFGYSVACQPPETLSPSGLTQSDYARGAKRYGGNVYADDDVSHMGAEYGQLVLDQIESALEASPRTAAHPPTSRAIRVARKRWRKLTQLFRSAFQTGQANVAGRKDSSRR